MLASVHSALPQSLASQFAAQVRCVNKIQRLLEWNEVEFYAMRWFKVAWPEEVLFKDRSEMLLARVTLSWSEGRQDVEVFVVGGVVFSLESNRRMKPLRKMTSLATSVELEASTIQKIG